MREALSRILRVRHQTVYGTRPDTDTSAFRRWGFEHGDGWFGLVDSVSSVLGMRAAERGLDISVTQIKQKCRTLRWHSGGLDEFCRGATEFAGAMSGRLCELSGCPGLPSVIGHELCTLAPGELPEAEIRADSKPIERFIAACGPLRAIASVRTVWSMTHIDVPAGYADVTDVLMGFLTADNAAVDYAHTIVASLEADKENGMIVGMADLDDRRRGGIAVAASLARTWIDPISGATGPVDDLGRPPRAVRHERF
jgi:hypothetical protein